MGGSIPHDLGEVKDLAITLSGIGDTVKVAFVKGISLIVVPSISD